MRPLALPFALCLALATLAGPGGAAASDPKLGRAERKAQDRVQRKIDRARRKQRPGGQGDFAPSYDHGIPAEV